MGTAAAEGLQAHAVRQPGAGQAQLQRRAQAPAGPVDGRHRGPRAAAERLPDHRRPARRARDGATPRAPAATARSPRSRPWSSSARWRRPSSRARAGRPSRRRSSRGARCKDSFPDILRGFWLDVKIFCIVEVVVLVVGLAIALARNSRAPALSPLRLLGTLFVDVLRGVPTILVVYLIGFGVPALELAARALRPGGPRRRRARAVLLRLRGRGLPRGDRVRAPQPARGRARARAQRGPGHAPRRSCRRPCGASCRRCSTTSSRCRRTSRSSRSSVRSRRSAWRRSPRRATSTTRRSWASPLLYLCVTIPLARFVDRMQRRRQAR